MHPNYIDKNGIYHLQSKSKQTSWLKRNGVTTTIGFAITLLLCIQWHFAIMHTRDIHQPHDLFLSSFSSSTSKRKRRLPTAKRKQSKDDYITSPICGACTRSYFDTRPCYTIMQREVQKSKISILEAAKKLGRESKTCDICNPDTCYQHYINSSNNTDTSASSSQHQAKYWRFDRSYPNYINPTTISLSSIPNERRIPPSRFEDIGIYFQEKFNYAKSHNTSNDYLLEYNPGLVVIPSKMKNKLPNEATYLVSLRVTPANNCFSTQVYANLPKDVWTAVYHTSINHLGLALLDENYQIIPNYEVVIEVDIQLDLKRDMESKRTGKIVEASPTFMDYRLFMLNDEIYLHINADTVIVSRLELRSKAYHDDEEDIDKCVNVAKEAGELGWFEKPCRLDNLYGGDNLQVTLMRQFNTIWSGGVYGKNYALFGIPNSTHPNEPDAVYAELDIFPHHVQQILPEEYDKLEKKQVFERIWKPGTNKRRKFKIDRVNMRAIKEVGNTTESDDAPLPSFSTVDAHIDWFPGQDAPFKESAHGGACCVSFSADELNAGGTKKDHHESLLVGLGHTKVTWKPWYNKANVPQEKKDRVPHTHYVSLFYAFEPYPPFKIRARSGYFCLAHAPSLSGNKLAPTEGGTFNPHSKLTYNRPLLQNNITFDCPQMSFVSSFIEKADDSSATLIGYGLNDCTGRIVEVEKKEIVRLLYPDPNDMLFE